MPGVHVRNACSVWAGSTSSGEMRRAGCGRLQWDDGDRAPRQLGVGLEVKGLWVGAEASRLMGMSVWRNGIFPKSEKSMGWSALHRQGWSIFPQVLRCVSHGSIRGKMVQWPWSNKIYVQVSSQLIVYKACNILSSRLFKFSIYHDLKTWKLLQKRIKMAFLGLTSHNLQPIKISVANVKSMWPRLDVQLCYQGHHVKPQHCNSVDCISLTRTHRWRESWRMGDAVSIALIRSQ